MTHTELCEKGAKFLLNHQIVPYHKCQYVICELERIGESPDIIGIASNHLQLIEVKVSRSDFLADKKKHWRIYPYSGIGSFRCYLCPDSLIKEEELPYNWGLLYLIGNKIKLIKHPLEQKSNHYEEIALMSSILRREGIKKYLSYKNHKS